MLDEIVSGRSVLVTWHLGNCLWKLRVGTALRSQTTSKHVSLDLDTARPVDPGRAKTWASNACAETGNRRSIRIVAVAEPAKISRGAKDQGKASDSHGRDGDGDDTGTR